MSQSPQALFLSVVAPTAPTPRLTPAPAQPPASTPPATPAPESTIPAPQTQEEKPVEFEVVAEEAGEYNVPDAQLRPKPIPLCGRFRSQFK